MSTNAQNAHVRLSFAQVAAAANRTVPKPKNVEPTNQNSKPKANGSIRKELNDVKKPLQNDSVADGARLQEQSVNGQSNGSAPASENIAGALQNVSLHPKQSSATLSGLTSNKAMLLKHESSDAKSSVSHHTIQLDEKESLRPDDSASMQAGTEGDGPSPPEYEATESRRASELGCAFQGQLHVIDEAENSRMVAQRALLGRVSDDALPNSAKDMSHPESQINSAFRMTPSPAPRVEQGPPLGFVLPPDEKLLEALASPKDRLFVLKIEQDMIDFIRDPKELELQLPQTNSFYRMLSHKLAEYYFLGHVYDELSTSVRIYRQPFSRLPPPLADCGIRTRGPTPPLSSARKIMQRDSRPSTSRERNELNDPVAVPRVWPKVTRDAVTRRSSDNDKDGSSENKEKANLTREQREQRYNEARERIFKETPKASVIKENGASNDTGAGISRSSSSSGVKRNRKQKKPKDDSFQARSAYSQFGTHAMLQTSQPSTPYGMPYQPAYPQYAPLNSTAPAFQSAYAPMPHVNPQQAYMASGWSVNETADPNTYGQGFFAPNQFAPVGYDNSTPVQAFNTPNNASQATPKAQNPGLATYGQAYQPQTVQDQTNWSNMGFMYGYMPTMAYGDPNSVATSSHQSQMMAYGMPYANGFATPDMSSYGPVPTNMAHYNPQAQAFIPQPVTNKQAPTHGPNGWYPTQQSQPLQRQQSNTSYTSNIAASPAHRASANGNGNSRQHNSNVNANPTAHPPQQQSSIAKFTNQATTNSLPAKPPPTSSSLSFQPPKYSTDKPQPLPSNPLANGNRQASPPKDGAVAMASS